MILPSRRIVVAVAWLLSVGAAFAWGRSWPWPRFAREAKVAVMIDDCGYHNDTMALLRALERPVTLAVLPHLTYSKAVAELGAAERFEVMLHLPMEPRTGRVPEYGLERHTVTTRMSESEIRRQLAEALDSVPHARGVNNHMGSKATADAATMQVVLKALKARRLYFVDSLVTSDSVCAAVAERVGVRFGQRAVFLDNENRADYISGQLRKLVSYAKRHGSAIGIGHDRATTLSVLQRMMPELENDGVRFVRVSELVKN